MKTDHRVLLWCVAAWMFCIVVNCSVEFFDTDGNTLREEDILDKDWILKDDKVKIWEDSYRRKPYLGNFRADGDTGEEKEGNDLDETKKKECRNTCGLKKEPFELVEDNIKCLHDKDPVECECVETDGGEKGFNYKTKECTQCNCGEESSGCSFDKDGEKTCTCEIGSADKAGTCEKCNCGEESSGCSFDKDEEKTCTCKIGSAVKAGICEKCNCGEESSGCSFDKDEEKTCTCKIGSAEKAGTCEKCDCGEHSNSCKYEGENKICGCNEGFKENNGICQECKCGENTQPCRFEKGEKKCDCKDKFAYNKEGKCTECNCGVNTADCTFDTNDEKKCVCKPGFSLKEGQCEVCDCGKNAEGCSFNNDGTKKCACKENFAQKGETCEDEKCVKECGVKEDVTCERKEDNIECKCEVKAKKFDNRVKECRIPCVDDSNCTNGGICEGDKDMQFCECPRGTSGDTCENITDCETGKYSKCKGGRGNCTYDSKKMIAVCHCAKGKKLMDKSGQCALCNCGENSEDCEFLDDQVSCKCKSGYSSNNGKCVECNCGDDMTSCSFIDDQKKCVCKEGFGDDRGTCKKCGCDENSKGCTFKEGKPTCICKEKFALKEDKCEECNCGEHSNSCKFEGENKICDCKDGFKDNGICQECNCGVNGTACEFQEGKKVCKCKSNNAQNGDKCEECKCGANTKPCRFENGEKKCDCREKFGYKEGNCTECKCGTKSTGCTFNEENKKECQCEKGYGDKDGTCTVDQCFKKCGVPPEGHEDAKCEGTIYGNGDDIKCLCYEDSLKFDSSAKKCRETCEDDTKCKNAAKCETIGDKKFCKCLKNTDGHQCENIRECEKGQTYEKCIGDRGTCTYDSKGQKAVCNCNKNQLLDPKENYCQDTCTKDEDCSKNNKVCFEGSKGKYCSCEEGKKGDNCEIASGCTEELVKKCNNASAECVFRKSAKNFAACVCKDVNLVFNEAKNECVAKFCNDVGCKSGAKCEFDADTRTAYCNCSSGKYYDYSTEKCSAPDKCLLKKTPCKENEVCEGGECKCKGEKKEDKCIVKFCKDDKTCFEGAKCDEETATCKCEDGKYFTGSSCKDVKCIKDPFDESCKCPLYMERDKESKKCVPTAGKTSCDKDCGLGLCVNDKCSCITGISRPHEGKCVLDKDICASKELEDSSKCKCTGKYKPAKDGITCELVTCSDDVAKQKCKNEKATCKMTWKGKSIGYDCDCPAGYTLNTETGICTDSCSVYEIAEKCSLNKQVCYNSYSLENRETTTCDCAPPFKTTTKFCDDVAEYAYLISGIPVMKQKYQMEYGIDYVRLNRDLVQSLSQMYNKDIFDSGYLHDYVEVGDVLETSVWVRFKQNISGQLDRFKLQAQSFPNGTCEDCDTDLYVWPPNVVLKSNDFKNVKTESLNVCASAMKNTLCGKEADCKDNKCFCPRGYRTLEYTIQTISNKSRILRCEKSNGVDLDECALGTHTCPGNTTCFKIPGTYICKCKPGYWKSTENDQKDCVDMCTPSPCEKGTCSIKKDKFNCKCQAGYSGSYCDEQDLNFASAKKSTVIVGAVLGTILIVGVLAALFFYIKKRKSSYNEDFMPAPRQDIASEMRERRPIRGVVNNSYE